MLTEVAIQEFLSSRTSKNDSPITIGWYRQKLRRFALSFPELPRKPGPIDAFLAGIEGQPETRHAYFRALRALYRFTKKRHKHPNPMDSDVEQPVVPRKEMSTLEPGEIMKLRLSATKLQDRAIITLFSDNGIRTSELCTLRTENIRSQTVIVSGKTGVREVPISEETRIMLLSLVAQNGKDGFVFHGQRGPLTRKGAYLIIRKHMERAGIKGPKLGGHRIRHAFGKGYIVNGGDTRSLQKIMGHKRITTTEKYVNMNLTDTINKHHKFTLLNSVKASAQGSLLGPNTIIEEAEEILQEKNK